MRRRLHRQRNRLLSAVWLLAASAFLCMAFIPAGNTGKPAPLPLVPDREQTVRVYLKSCDTLCNMELEEYVARVVAAEMPSSYHPEALRAQAVAARSYTLFRMKICGGSGCASHPEADVCAGAGCCQAYAEYMPDERILSAVSDTHGEVLRYGGAVINALYHASSGGQTENSEAVFSEALPYLRSVESPGEEIYPRYAAESVYTREQLSTLIELDSALPLEKQLSVLTYDASGRAQTVQAGREILSGTEFRKRLSLPSARMHFTCSADTLTVHTTGFGHGVGLSQAGAEAMARRGAAYTEILSWYYTGCTVSPIP